MNYKDILISEYKNNIHGGLYELTQIILAYNSNKIEGSRLTEEQTRDLFKTKCLISTEEDQIFRSVDIEEMNGHFYMFNKMIDTLNDNLSENLIKSFHYCLKSGVFSDKLNGYNIGEYKSIPNIVGDIVTANPKNVSKEMKELINSYNKSDKTFEDIIDFHVKYETIHPFQDGNGRTGRIIMFRESLKNLNQPIVIEDDTKLKYYRGLNEYRKGNKEYLLNYCKDCQDFYINRMKNLKYNVNWN